MRRAETNMSHRLRDEMSARIDQLSGELRKARMFAASEDFYVDRRLVANVVISYFIGMKVCFILSCVCGRSLFSRGVRCRIWDENCRKSIMLAWGVSRRWRFLSSIAWMYSAFSDACAEGRCFREICIFPSEQKISEGLSYLLRACWKDGFRFEDSGFRSLAGENVDRRRTADMSVSDWPSWRCLYKFDQMLLVLIRVAYLHLLQKMALTASGVWCVDSERVASAVVLYLDLISFFLWLASVPSLHKSLEWNAS